MAAIVRNSPAKLIEVKDASSRLGLSKEIQKWSKEDVQKWILWAIREYYSVNLDLLEINGKGLVDLNLSEFQKRVPSLAVFFYNELQIWKDASGRKVESESVSVCVNNQNQEPNEDSLPTYVAQHSETPCASPVSDKELCSPVLPVCAQKENFSCSQNSQSCDNNLKNAEKREASLSIADDIPSVVENQGTKLQVLSNSETQVQYVKPKIQEDTLKTATLNSKLKLKIPNPTITVDSPPQVSKSFVDVPSSMSTPGLSLASSFPNSPNPLLTPPFGLLSPISPQVLGSRPKLLIPPPSSGLHLPYQFSPSVMAHSPFQSPLITPDIPSSPHFHSLPHMEALRENIIRLERERQKRVRTLDKHNNLGKKKTKSTSKSNKLNARDNINTSSDSVINSSFDNSITTPEIQINSSGAVFKNEKHNMILENSKAVVDNNSNMKVISPRHDVIPGLVPLDMLRQEEKTLRKSAEHVPITCSTSQGHTGKGYINIEPIPSCGSSPVTVRQNSYQIPYYQATSLQSLDRQTSEINDKNTEMNSLSIDSFKLKHEQISPMNLSTSRPESATRDSYSPISSPSDTEVDIPEGEHPLYHHPNIPHTVSTVDDSVPTSYSVHAGIPHTCASSFMQSQLLPKVLPPHVNSIHPVNLPKSPKRRGRPPGMKPLQKPLGPTDIQNSFFRANHLWKFLLEMLEQPHEFGEFIQWLDRPQGVFKIINSAYVASLWGKRKNNGRMTYDKFSRSIRQYYKKGIIIKTKPSKLIYQFGSNFFNPNGE